MEQEYKEACESSVTMGEAAMKLGVHFNTFKRNAIAFGLYTPNRGGKGIVKPKREGSGNIPLQDILDGKHPQYQTFKLKRKLFEAGVKTNCCEICGIDSWNDNVIQCELDHIDGNRCNHALENLRIICPNCHSQTDTFRAKNMKK